MLAWRARAIGPDETSVAVERGLADLGADLLLEAVAALDSGTAAETPQEHAAATLRPAHHTRDDGPDRLGPALARAPRPGARAASLAARVHLPRRSPLPHPGQPSCGDGVRRRLGRCPAGNADRGVRGSARGRRRRRFGPRDHGDPARGAAAVAGHARSSRDVAGRRGLRFDPRAAVTAPVPPAPRIASCAACTGGRADLATRPSIRARGPLDDPRDRALAGAIATGDAALARPQSTTCWRRSRGAPLERIDAAVLDILRAGVFQLRYPRSRAGARRRARRGSPLSREVAAPGADRFVNGLLRKLSDPRCPAILPPPRRRPEPGRTGPRRSTTWP